MRFRGTSIRRKIVALLLVPLISLSSIWAFAAVDAGRDVEGMLDVKAVLDTIGYPTEDAIQMLQNERRQALVHLADPRRSNTATQLAARERDTDVIVGRLLANAEAPRNLERMTSESRKRVDSILREIDGIDALREKIDQGDITRNDAYIAYNALIDPCYDFLASLNPYNDVEMDKQARALAELARARETVSREDALVAAALTAGRISEKELRSFSDAVAEQRLLYRSNLALLPAEDRIGYQEYWESPDGRALRTAEDAVIAAGVSGAPRAVDAVAWQANAKTVLEDLDRLGFAAAESYKGRVEPHAIAVLLKAGLVVGLGLVAVIVTIFISARVGRSLIRDLSGLRREAQQASGTRLPRVIRRLAAGEVVDIETEVPRLEYSDDEVGQVGGALNTLQRAAVEAAVRQADMRRGVSDVFVNLARRNQVLLHRQLTLLDAMERRTEDAEELADLFRLDHMTTRMRRHAEGLVILSGAAPSRQWRKPVQLMDVVRAAVAEVEDYERVDVRRLPRLAVAGPAVADVTHLIAELIENATVFSPPQTTVQVHGARVSNGFVLEVDDRGLGLTPDALLEANLRLAETPEFELSHTDRLGLFVVSRLARRQSVRVSLRPSPYGGTTAVVFIPSALLTDETDGAGSSDTTELELAGDFELPESGHESTFRRWGITSGRDDEPAEHHQVPDSAPDTGPALLPRRRRTPVLVSDHGRAVAEIPGTAKAAVPLSRVGGPAPERSSAVPGGLPRRVRQANLAPQLRTEDKAVAAAKDQPQESAARERTPEEVRDRMASLQRGWVRGREQQPPATEDRAPRMTSEGDGR